MLGPYHAKNFSYFENIIEIEKKVKIRVGEEEGKGRKNKGLRVVRGPAGWISAAVIEAVEVQKLWGWGNQGERNLPQVG